MSISTFFSSHRRPIVFIGIIVIVAFIASHWQENEGLMPLPFIESDDVMYDRGESFSVVTQNKEMAPPTVAGMPGEEAMYGGDGMDEMDRMIIQSAHVSAVVEDVRSTSESIGNKITELGGYVVNTELRGDDEERGMSAYMSLRVPQEAFESALSYIRSSVKRVTNESTSGVDITEEFVDNEARLANLEATEEQFLAIMKKATKIEDVLAVQRELTSVRERIERLKARQKFLEESVALSIITVNLSTDEANLPVVDDKDAWQPLTVVKEAARALLSVLEGAANLAIWAIVFLPLWGIAYLIHRWWKRRKGI